jgi:hypothetical protein
MPFRTDPTDRDPRLPRVEGEVPDVERVNPDEAKEAAQAFDAKPKPSDWQAKPAKRSRRGQKISLTPDAPPPALLRRPVPSREEIASAQATLSAGTLRGPGATQAMDMLTAAVADPSATVVSKTKLGGGANGTYIVTLSNGVKAVWKPSAQETLVHFRWQLEPDHLARREAAAYVVDEALGHLTGAPPTVYRTLEGASGALMAFVGNANTATGRTLPEGPEYDALAVFDHVIGNLDRHPGNLLLTPDGHMIPIDHGLTFPLGNNRKGWSRLVFGNQGLHNFLFKKKVKLDAPALASLRQLVKQRDSVTQQLVALGIDPRAVSAMYERVEAMLDVGTTVDFWR